MVSLCGADQQGSVRPLHPPPASSSAAEWRLCKVMNLAQTLALGCWISSAFGLDWAASFCPETKGDSLAGRPAPRAGCDLRAKVWLSACRFSAALCFHLALETKAALFSRASYSDGSVVVVHAARYHSHEPRVALELLKCGSCDVFINFFHFN